MYLLNEGEKSLSEETELNSFYRAIAFWRDELSDEKHEEIGRLSCSVTEKNPKAFQPASLLFELCGGTC